ncbi:MAG: TVP38/TMEM64 family protein [Dehalococcoidia bacterium]|nr:TVP38/TMEM64 family protein [Dehalococcoidia bacterium]
MAIAGASALIMTDFIVGDLQVDDVREWIRDLGPWGPVLLITVLAVAMVVAPIPNPPFMIAAGIAWGTFWGVVYCVIGQLIGSAIIFYISHRLGRRFIPRLIGEEGAKRVDQMARQMGPQIVFWWRMMPVSFDFAAYAAGLTGMSFRLFITLVFLGSIVPTTVVVGFGDAFGKSWEAQAVTVALIAVALLVPATVFYFKYRESLPPSASGPGESLAAKSPAPPESRPSPFPGRWPLRSRRPGRRRGSSLLPPKRCTLGAAPGPQMARSQDGTQECFSRSISATPPSTSVSGTAIRSPTPGASASNRKSSPTNTASCS